MRLSVRLNLCNRTDGRAVGIKTNGTQKYQININTYTSEEKSSSMRYEGELRQQTEKKQKKNGK